jgi:D-alanyl-D-alanine carboxypeptidase/D-alanyl-D-alanine-endopeptidase (penicillin-binding protein 4)
MKLVTSGLALDTLGPAYEFSTRLYTQGTLLGKRLTGDLIVCGGGDPSTSRRFDGDPLLRDWAKDVARLLKSIDGDVVACAHGFESETLHPDWKPSDTEEWYGAPVSGLNLNDNCVDLETLNDGGVVRTKLFPETSFVSLDLRAQVARTAADHRVAYLREKLSGGGLRIRVEGKVLERAPAVIGPVVVSRPALFFATVLREQLIAEGVAISGAARERRETEPVPKGTPFLVKTTPLARALGVCNKRSQNLYAECLLKGVAHEKTGTGSWSAGAELAKAYLLGLGASPNEFRVRDGSGLSRLNRLSARVLVEVLGKRRPEQAEQLFQRSMAIAGEDGTLEKRLTLLPKNVRVLGKTGTLHGVSSLAGYVLINPTVRPQTTVAFVSGQVRKNNHHRTTQSLAVL